jgi:transcriptional regulator with XRE-family HTH domain
MNDLKKYKIETGLKNRDIARICGVTTATVSYWLNGKHSPRAKYILILERVSGGKVTLKSWVRNGF